MKNLNSKTSSEILSTKLKIIIKTGKYSYGYQSTLKCLRKGNCKMIIITDNCIPLRKLELEYYAMLNKCHVHHFYGNNIDLGISCGKTYGCSCLGITDAGEVNFKDII
mmetsp:Transcript_8438/g.19131  ORF Transcript_8438/g.19131 Transcript_8438/m.19131 type:complete len:108 (+) Transcript_8438:1042-1365(+)